MSSVEGKIAKITFPVQFAAATSSAHSHTNGLQDDGSGSCGPTLAAASAAAAAITHTKAEAAKASE